MDLLDNLKIKTLQLVCYKNEVYTLDEYMRMYAKKIFEEQMDKKIKKIEKGVKKSEKELKELEKMQRDRKSVV